LNRNCLLKHVIEEKIDGIIDEKTTKKAQAATEWPYGK
jgi:hypothetical protein